MHTKISLYLFITGVIFSTNALGQNLTKSPYSRFGIGELNFQGFAQQNAMGQLTQGVRSDKSYSLSNPASLSALRLATFDFGGIGSIGQLSENNSPSQQVSNASLGWLTLAMPLNRRLGWAAAFGITSFSNVGYNISNTIDSSFGSFDRRFEGRGGLSRFFIGSGIRLHRNVSIGVNASYLFGQTVSSKVLAFQPSQPYLSYRENTTSYIGGFHFEGGLQYHADVKRRNTDTVLFRHTLGFTYTLQNSIDVQRELFARTFDNINGIENVRDTVLFNDALQGKAALPASIAIGYMAEATDRSWRIGAEYRTAFWSAFSTPGSTETLLNNYSFHLGGALNTKSDKLDRKTNFLKRTEYRMGGRYGKSYLNLNGTQLKEYGVSVGFGFPVVLMTYTENFQPRREVSQLNFSVEYISLGTQENNLIREKYLRFTVGVTLSDKWFNKRKIE